MNLPKRINIKNLSILLLALSAQTETIAQEPANDVTTPLHLLQPDYPTPYGAKSVEEITATLDRVYNFLDASTPSTLVDSKSNKEVTNLKKLDENTIFAPGAFRLTSYEWGVTYAGMLLASEATGNPKYTNYTNDRIKLIADIAPYYWEQLKNKKDFPSPISSVLKPHALDDAGAICAAMIKAERAGIKADLRPLIDNFIDYISNKEFRFSDGTLARNRPQPNTLWLDDLFMSVPALAQMGKL
ncbi:unnamed protein product, partial [Scytosiphon promiscuus]